MYRKIIQLRYSSVAVAICAVACFVFLGIQNIGKFETVDEHFWKYERIPKYWQAWENLNLKKTAVNDKPGITVTLFNGIGLLWVDPLMHEIQDSALTKNEALTLFDISQTEEINQALRIPGLLVDALLILLSGFLLYLITRHVLLTSLWVIFLATSPILLGIAQIMNPDTYLWSFSIVSLLAWLAYLFSKQEKALLVLSAVALAFALLSKYTAYIFIPFFFVLPFFFFNTSEVRFWKKIYRDFWIFLFIVFVTFSVFLPAVFFKEGLLWKATLGFYAELGVLWPLLLLWTCVYLVVWRLPSWFVWSVEKKEWLWKKSKFFLILFPTLLFLSVLLVGMGDQSILPLNSHFLAAKNGGNLEFTEIKPGTSLPLVSYIKLATELYTLLFSLHPLVLVGVFFWLGSLVVTRDGTLRTRYWWIEKLSVALVWFVVLFAIMNLLAHVLLNARYSIVLFPLMYLLALFGFGEFWYRVRGATSLLASTLFVFVIFWILFSSLLHAKPFYFNYASPLLDQQFAVHDAWGYGLYEAAQYLNATIPEDRGLVYVWSDRTGLCQFLLPHIQCVSGYKIDKAITPLSYIVVSKRGLERGYRPRYEDPQTKKLSKPIDYTILSQYTLWRLDILDRPDNFILVARVPAVLEDVLPENGKEATTLSEE